MHPAAGERGLCGPEGGGARRVPVARGPGLPAGLSGRSQQAIGRRDARAPAPAPLPLRPGDVAHEDYEDVRNGVATLFMFCAPLRGWRPVTVTERRTRVDWAYARRDLVAVYFPTATTIRVVSDTLNTPDPGSLYEAFAPEEARRILDRLALHHTPKHGSWLTRAEIELRVRGRPCLDRRIPDHDTLAREVAAWEAPRNDAAAAMDWRFTTVDARIKLKHLYPVTTLPAQATAPASLIQATDQVA